MDLNWEERLPLSYKALLRKVRGIADLEALRDLGKRVYALDLARDQAGSSGTNMGNPGTGSWWASGRTLAGPPGIS
jgi:hypothetical protein